jgi:hypothetical protein
MESIEPLITPMPLSRKFILSSVVTRSHQTLVYLMNSRHHHFLYMEESQAEEVAAVVGGEREAKGVCHMGEKRTMNQ